MLNSTTPLPEAPMNQTAQGLAALGRGPDTELVHMAPSEIAGLQALAKAHGGSLTINPETGLAEAGFLSSILPTVIGAGLAATGVGAPMAALMVGGGMTLATGSLQKGLMAGLGAYGGAGLAGGLMGAGAAGAGAAAAGEATLAGELAAQNALTEAAASNAAMAGTESAASAAASATPDFAAFNATPSEFGAFGEAAGSYVPPTQAGAMVPTTVSMPVSGAGFSPEQMAQSAREFAADSAGNAASPFTSGTQAALNSPMETGLKGLTSPEGRAAFLDKTGGLKGLAKYGGAALAPVALDAMQPTVTGMPTPEKVEPRNYDYSYNMVENPQENYTGAYTGERTYFNPTYTRMAEGGETSSAVKRVEDDPYFTMTGQSADAYKYLMGQAPRPAAPMQPPASAPAPVQSQVQAPAGAPSGIGSLFGSLFGSGDSKLGTSIGSFADRITNGRLAGSQGQGAGSWQDAPGNLKPYSFDPVTGTFTAQPAPKVWVPYSAPMSMSDSGGGGGDYGGGSGGYGDSGGFGGMNGSAGGGDGVGNGEGGAYAANGGLMALAGGGSAQYNLGGYSDGGRLLRGPGDGVSDDIPATIGQKQPARLADGEFVVPARIVSELGNGSTEAGARKLYAMMDRVQSARKKSIGKNKVAADSKAHKLLPA